MRGGRGLLVLALVALSRARPAGAAPDEGPGPGEPPAYTAFYEGFTTLRPDSSRVTAVASLELERDAGILVFEEGRIALCLPVAGGVCAALFEGRGVFAFTPRTAIERAQLERNYGAKSLRYPFTTAVLVFADSTLEELTGRFTFAPGQVSDEARLALRLAVRRLSYETSRTVTPEIARPLLEGDRDGSFYAELDAGGVEPVAFEIAPMYTESVRLLRPAKETREGLLRPVRLEVVSQFPPAAAPAADSASDLRPTVAIRHYQIDASITGRPAFSAQCQATLEARESRRWVLLGLDDTLRVTSAEWRESGADTAAANRWRATPFHKGRGSHQLWIQCDPPLEAGRSYALRLRYEGPVLQRNDDWFNFRSAFAATGWYPWGDDSRTGATFDLRYHVESPIQLVSVGALTSSQSRGRFVDSHWIVDRPTRWASFNLGFFKSFRVTDPRLPPVTVMMSSRGHRELADSLAEEAEAPGAGMEKQVAQDVANSLLFFQERFGPSGVESFHATETPLAHGLAFPGLIHLSTATFQSPRAAGQDQLFRAHEVAHQWWGVGLDVRTYHDQWLSEGFAEFSALWYLESTARERSRYLHWLEEWRREIVGNRRYVFGSGQPAGPIWLGPRTHTSTTLGDYDLIVYGKGAWVLHMLREMMRDPDTGSDERFAGMLRDFYSVFHGRRASTADFRALAEQSLRQDLGWFFDQWVYGTDVPSYRFAWRSQRGADGKWTVRCRVEQRNVPEGFRMPVPIRVEFSGRDGVRARAWVRGPSTEFDLPPVPREPRRVSFNDGLAVLCEVENVKW